jgi:beta-lactamase regulating signal transducer with metallopeptidase domain
MSPAGAYSVPSAAAHALLHTLWQGALLAVIAAVVLSLVPPRRAAARHAVGLACLVAMALAPIATFMVYARVGLPGLAPTSPAHATPLLLRSSDWLVVAVPLAWMLGATAMLARQLGGWRVVIALSRRPAHALPSSWLCRVDVLRHALGIARVVTLRPATGTVSPFTARTLRPVIWLPTSLWGRLPPAQQDALLAHELAHVRRLDWVWNGLQSLVEALVFFHPAVWWLGRRVRQEREHACDDLAVAACGDALALAEALATLERQRGAGPDLVLAAHGGALLQRVTRLLGSPPPAPRRVPIGLVIWLACGAALASQLQLPADVLINVRVDASTDGPLTPGAFRELTADAFATHRHYRSTMDDHGRVVELYEENGQPRPIDPSVRTWLNELTSTAGWR